MTKRTIFKILAVVVILLGVYFAMAWKHMRALQRSWLAGLAHELITTTNSPRVFFISPELKTRLAQMLASPTGVESIEHRDAPPPVGDGSAMHFLILTNANGLRLGIRFRPGDSNKLDIIGFWTPAKPLP